MMSAFTTGIVFAKKGRDKKDNPFKKSTQKHDWFNDGYNEAFSDRRLDKKEKRLVDKPIYERYAELIEK